MSDLALAVDIGGTKMAVGLVDQAGCVRHRQQVPTPAAELEVGTGPGEERAARAGRAARAEQAEPMWRDLVDLIERVRAKAGDDRIVVCGVGCGGPMGPGGEEVSPLNIPGWRSFPLRRGGSAAPPAGGTSSAWWCPPVWVGG
jgi:glucokinase